GEPVQIADNLTRNSATTPGRVLRIEQGTAAGQTRINIVLDRMVSYRSELLREPDRLYFDFDYVRPGAQLQPVTNVGADTLVSKVVVGEHEPGVTRVVIHLRVPSSYQIVAAPERAAIAITFTSTDVPVAVAASSR